jgi:hypothetical protein
MSVKLLFVTSVKLPASIHHPVSEHMNDMRAPMCVALMILALMACTAQCARVTPHLVAALDNNELPVAAASSSLLQVENEYRSNSVALRLLACPLQASFNLQNILTSYFVPSYFIFFFVCAHYCMCALFHMHSPPCTSFITSFSCL